MSKTGKRSSLGRWGVSRATPASSALLRAIVHSSDDAIISKDLKGTILSWNKGAERVFGYTAQEAIGRCITILIPPDRQQEEPLILERLKRGERIDHFETVRMAKSGKLIDISLTVSPINTRSGKVVGASKVARDITESRRSQDAAALLTAIVDSSDDAIVSKDLNGVITSWNAGAQRIFGYTPQEVVGKHISILIPPDRLDEEPQILDRLKRGERVDHFETVRITKDGRLIDISLTISPVKDAQGRVIGASKVARDITERRRIDAELQQYRKRLEDLVDQRTAELDLSHQRLRSSERLSSLGTLSAGLGHDIGNVMMPLGAHVKALEGKLGISASLMSEHFEAIHRSIEYLQNLSNGLRLLAIDPEMRPHNGGQVDLSAWWKQTEPLLKTIITRGIALEHDFAPNLPLLAMPEHLLTQAVFNLVQNAAQAIAAENARPPLKAGLVRISAAVPDDSATMMRLSICDNGPGMANDIRDRCLEPFFTTKTRGISTGLGLAVVHGIVQNAGGTLDIDTAPDQGTTFHMTLPTANRNRIRQSPPQHVAVMDIGNARLRAVVSHELESLNIGWAEGNGAPLPLADVMIIDEGDDRRTAALDFLERHPHGRVVIVGCQPSPLTSDRMIEVGPVVKRDLLRQALQNAVA